MTIITSRIDRCEPVRITLSAVISPSPTSSNYQGYSTSTWIPQTASDANVTLPTAIATTQQTIYQSMSVRNGTAQWIPNTTITDVGSEPSSDTDELDGSCSQYGGGWGNDSGESDPNWLTSIDSGSDDGHSTIWVNGTTYYVQSEGSQDTDLYSGSAGDDPSPAYAADNNCYLAGDNDDVQAVPLPAVRQFNVGSAQNYWTFANYYMPTNTVGYTTYTVYNNSNFQYDQTTISTDYSTCGGLCTTYYAGANQIANYPYIGNINHVFTPQYSLNQASALSETCPDPSNLSDPADHVSNNPSNPLIPACVPNYQLPQMTVYYVNGNNNYPFCLSYQVNPCSAPSSGDVPSPVTPTTYAFPWTGSATSYVEAQKTDLLNQNPNTTYSVSYQEATGLSSQTVGVYAGRNSNYDPGSCPGTNGYQTATPCQWTRTLDADSSDGDAGSATWTDSLQTTSTHNWYTSQTQSVYTSVTASSYQQYGASDPVPYNVVGSSPTVNWQVPTIEAEYYNPLLSYTMNFPLATQTYLDILVDPLPVLQVQPTGTTTSYVPSASGLTTIPMVYAAHNEKSRM